MLLHTIIRPELDVAVVFPHLRNLHHHITIIVVVVIIIIIIIIIISIKLKRRMLVCPVGFSCKVVMEAF
jgi:hypothetical protein